MENLPEVPAQNAEVVVEKQVERSIKKPIVIGIVLLTVIAVAGLTLFLRLRNRKPLIQEVTPSKFSFADLLPTPDPCLIQGNTLNLPCKIKINFNSNTVRQDSVQITKMFIVKLLSDIGIKLDSTQVFYLSETDSYFAVVNTPIGQEEKTGKEIVQKYSKYATSFEAIPNPTEILFE